MLSQSNLAPPSPSAFDSTRHSCRGDILSPPSFPDVLLIVRWNKTIQVGGRTHVLPIPSIPGHPAEPVWSYKHLLPSPSTTSSNQPLLTFTSHSGMVTVIVRMLAQALCVML